MSFLKNLTSKIFGSQSRASGAYANFDANEVEVIGYQSDILFNSGVAAKAVDIIAGACMNTEPVCVDDAGKTVLTTATKLLKKPNKEATGDALVYKIVEDIYIGTCAKSFIVMVGSLRTAPSEIFRIDPRKLSEFTDVNGTVVQYSILNDSLAGTFTRDDDGRFFDGDFKELVVIQHPSEKGILNSVREELEVLSTGLNRNGALIKNGGRISTLLAFRDNPSQDEMVARIASVERTIRSKGYGGLLGVGAGEHGVDVKEMGLSPRDLDFKELQEFCRREVYFRCGVPLPLIDNKAATDNNMAAAREMMVNTTVIPLCDLIYSVIGEAIARRERKQYTCKTNQTIIPEIRSRIISEIKERKTIGIETINELRAHAGLEPNVGGDVLLVESRMVDIGSLGETNNTGVVE